MTSKQIEAMCKAIEMLCKTSGWAQAVNDDAFAKACDEAVALLSEALKEDRKEKNQ